VLREAAMLHKEGLGLNELVEKISQRFLCEALFTQSPWLEIFACGHFPRLSWVELPEDVRKEILRAFPLPYGEQPLPMIDLRRLANILDDWDL
jgi:hypothetical protein